MWRFIRELFHWSSYDRRRPRYYYDDAVMSYHGAGPSILPDVVLRVPMETMKDVERVKRVLAIEGVHRVRCDMATQTVVVSGNVPHKYLLRRVRWVKRHSSILSFGEAPYASPMAYGSPYPANIPYEPYAFEQYPSRTPPFDSTYGTQYDMEYRHGQSLYGTPSRTPYTRYRLHY